MTPEHTALKQELSDLHDWLENPTNNDEDDERVQKKLARLVQLTGVLIGELEAKTITPPSVLKFPSLLLKQWTGDEVQTWINEQLAKQPTPEVAAWRVTDAKGEPLTSWTSGEPNKNIIDHEWTQGKRIELSYKAPLPSAPKEKSKLANDWEYKGYNCCIEQAAKAIPILLKLWPAQGGEQPFNEEHCRQIAEELEHEMNNRRIALAEKSQ